MSNGWARRRCAQRWRGDDSLEGGTGADVFVFEGDLGHDTVLDFNADQDDQLVFIFHNDAFEDWTAQSILGASSQVGQNVVIDLDASGDRATLVGIDLATLTTDDIDVFSYV
ncbi:hypothetical protein [Roseobacter sp.]|uniref:hypothetical protein n=1 Tax=Roseobacter sp. TaxID=1907202 RepID=UPI0032995F1E